jgi:heat shock protein HslJ
MIAPARIRPAAAALLFAASACTATEPAPTPAPAPEPLPLESAPVPPPVPERRLLDPRDLVGTRWLLAEAAGTTVEPGSGERPWVEFGARALGGHSGCNNYGTEFQVEGGRFVTAGIEANAQGCGPPVGTTEERLFRALGSPFEAELDGEERLVIVKDGAPALRFRRVQPAPPLTGRPAPAALVGTRWRLVEADGRSIGDDPAYQMVTLDFGERSFNGGSGCNGYSAEFRLQGARFLPTPVMATQRGCGPPVGTLERRLFQILGGPFEVDADAQGRLIVLSGGVPVLRFVAR